jgi:hypothetical protein
LQRIAELGVEVGDQLMRFGEGSSALEHPERWTYVAGFEPEEVRAYQRVREALRESTSFEVDPGCGRVAPGQADNANMRALEFPAHV